MAQNSRRSKQLKSKQRVADYGEVFTAEREVNAMLDLIANEVMRIASRFLEPACGDGNFLVEILRRKLSVVEDQCAYKITEYERFAFLAISTLYQVDTRKPLALCQRMNRATIPSFAI